MEENTEKHGPLGASSKRLARRLLTIGETRLELLLIEAVEERERFIRSLVLALGIFAFGLLGVITLTAAIVVSLWNYSPVIVLFSVSALYLAVTVILYRQLRQTIRHREAFSATFEQIQKDHACLKKILS